MVFILQSPNLLLSASSRRWWSLCGGTARLAMNCFGAVWGLQGRSYAIPTMRGGVETIRPYVDEFIAFARRHRELLFLVTRIGCGIAGFRDAEISPLFKVVLEGGGECHPAEGVRGGP